MRAFKEQIKMEQELEDARSRLALQSDFNLPDAFDILDGGSKGYTTTYEIVDVLATFGVYVSREDVQLFVKRYDKNNDGKLRYHEFCEAFNPKTASYSTQLNLRKSYYSGLRYAKTDYFTRDTRDLFLRTLKTHFSVEQSAEYLRKRLFRRPGFNAHDAFTACDTDKNGYITRVEFKNILRDYGFYATETEAQWLIDRYDRNNDGRISYSEFVEEIMPKSPSRI